MIYRGNNRASKVDRSWFFANWGRFEPFFVGTPVALDVIRAGSKNESVKNTNDEDTP